MASDPSSASSPSSLSFSRSSSIGSEGWEFVDWARKSGKEMFLKELHFDENVVLEMDYFDCPACTPRGTTKTGGGTGEKPPCTCTGTSARGSRIPPAAAPPRPMILADRDSVSQVLFMKSDQENKFVSMTLVSPRTSESKGSSEPLKENNFYNLSLISPRTPRAPMIPRIPKSTPVELDEMKEKKLTRAASRRPPKSPSSKWLAVPEEAETIINEKRNNGASAISPGSPGRMPSLSDLPSLRETQTGLGIINTRIELDSAPEDSFPGFPPTSEGPMKPADFEPEQMVGESNYVGFGVLSPRPRVIGELSPVCAASNEEEEEEADEDEMEEKKKQEAPEEEAGKDHVDDQKKKKKVNERGQNKLGGIGALASFGVAAAATMAVLVLGGGNQVRAKSSSIGTGTGTGTGSSSRQKRN